MIDTRRANLKAQPHHLSIAASRKNLWCAADIGGDYRQAAGCRFEKDPSERLLAGSMDESGALGKQLLDVVTLAEEVNAAKERSLRSAFV